MRDRVKSALLLVLLVWTPALFGFAPPGNDDPTVVVVRMIDVSPTEFAFSPADIAVQPGDVIRFIQTGVQPHNVEFRDRPDRANLGAAAMGPFLLKEGDVYELQIDDRFVPGEYRFVCTPHEPMGMRGTLTVEAS